MPVSVPIRGYIEARDAMLLIPCPYCGPRDEGEFTYGGPEREMSVLEVETHCETAQTALYRGINPQGVLRELWYHSSGCERWITLNRNTVTHEIEPEIP